MEERLRKIPALKIVLSIFFVIILTGIPILHISRAPRVEISQTAKIADSIVVAVALQTVKIVDSIILAVALILTYGIGLVLIIKDITNKFRRRKADNEAFFIAWILFCAGVLLLDIFLGTIWSKVDWMKLLDW